MPIPILAFMAPVEEDASSTEGNDSGGWKIKEGPLLCVVPLCITAVGSVVLFFFANQIYQWLIPILQSGH